MGDEFLEYRDIEGSQSGSSIQQSSALSTSISKRSSISIPTRHIKKLKSEKSYV